METIKIESFDKALERMIKHKHWERWGISEAEFMEYMEKKHARDANVPQVGEPAPHFEAERLDIRGKRTGEKFAFDGAGGKPVAFVFGSYT